MSGNKIKTIEEQIYNDVFYYYFEDPGQNSNGEYNYFNVADGVYEHLKNKSRDDQIKLIINFITHVKKTHTPFFMHWVVVTYVQSNPKFIKDLVQILDFQYNKFKEKSDEYRAEKLLDIILANSPKAKSEQSQDVTNHSSSQTSDTDSSAKEQEEYVTDSSASQLPPEPIVPQYEELKDAAEKTLGLLMNLDGEINIAHVDALTNIMWEMSQQIDDDVSRMDEQKLLEYHETVKSILQEVVAKLSEVNSVKSNQKLTGLQQQVQEIVAPLQNSLDQMKQQSAALQAQANKLFYTPTSAKSKKEVNMPSSTTLPKPEDVLQDVIRAFNASTSVDGHGKKDYVDVLFSVYQKHLEGKTPEQQKKILQGLIEGLQGISIFQNVGLGIRNPLAAFKISRIISAPNAPQWIKDIGNMSYDNASDGATQLYNTIHKQIDAMSTPNGSIAINSTAYNNFVANHPADEKAPSLLDRIKAFFSNIFTSIKGMFVAKDPELITPSPEMTLQQKLATEKELLLGRLGALNVNEIKCNIKSEKKNLLVVELIQRVEVLKKDVNNEDSGIDRIKKDIADLEQDVAKLKEPNLNKEDIKNLLSKYSPEPESKLTPAGPKKATMLPSLGAKAKSMENSAKSFARNVGGFFRKTGNKKPQD